MACYLAVEAFFGAPVDIKMVEPDLNYEIQELEMPKNNEREMSPGKFELVDLFQSCFQMKLLNSIQNKKMKDPM